MEELQLKINLEVFVKKYLKQIKRWHICSFDQNCTKSPTVKDKIDCECYHISFSTVRGEVIEVHMNKKEVSNMTVEEFEAQLMNQLKEAILSIFIEDYSNMAA